MPTTSEINAMSDDVIKFNTGKSMTDWTIILDKFKAKERNKERVIKHIKDCYGVNNWWAEIVFTRYSL